MSDERKIDILAPRVRQQGAASVLKATERSAPHAPETHAPEPAAKTPRSPKRTKPAVTTSKKVQLTADVPEELRGRARAAFRHAHFYERVGTFSEFVANALQAEIRRIELAHNDGEPLEPETENLTAGRPAR